MGFDFVTVLGDSRLMVMAGTKALEEMRAQAPA
jgi:hypothetical protein